MRCMFCGGEMRQEADGKYRCEFCGREAAGEEKRSFVTPRADEGVNVFDKNSKGVLEISCRFDSCAGAGSGFLIDERGYAITNTHVVTHNAKPCESMTVKIAGQKVPAAVLMLGDDKGGNGDGVDLALIKLGTVPRDAHPVRLGDFSKVRNGEQVFVIGNPLGDGMCITGGIVSDRERVLGGKTLLMTDCAVNGGNSGGPIFNGKGEVIGAIVSSRLNRDGSATEGMNYAIPSYIVQEFLQGKHTAVRLF